MLCPQVVSSVKSRGLKSCWTFPTRLVLSTWSFPDLEPGSWRCRERWRFSGCVLTAALRLNLLLSSLLKVSCSGRHTLRVTGVSSLDFRAGFSSVPVYEFNHTRERPIKGARHVFIFASILISPVFKVSNTAGFLCQSQQSMSSSRWELLKSGAERAFFHIAFPRFSIF